VGRTLWDGEIAQWEEYYGIVGELMQWADHYGIVG